MTAELNEECDNSTNPNSDGEAENTLHSNISAEVVTAIELPSEILDIFEFLSLNEHIIFKSQQIDDPEILRSEKVEIARAIFSRNRQTFLMRFGPHMEERHLETFARLALSDGAAPLRPEEHCEEMQFMLKDFQRKLHTRKRDVKNRRYAALQELIKKGEYFSEQEMMKRAPSQYQELIGQYLTDEEKKQRDGYDVKNTTFSGILMHSLEKQQLNDMLNQAVENCNSVRVDVKRVKDGTVDDSSNDSDFSHDIQSTNTQFGEHGVEEAVPVAFRQQWGNFDNEKIACSSSMETKPVLKKKQTQNTENSLRQVSADPTLITAGERELLRQEFIGLLHEQFLAGDDEDFDYTQVDDNSQLDDLQQLDQDKEDAYFEESDDEDEAESRSIDALILDGRHGSINEQDEESEDELDIYMNHLNNHHSLKN